MSSMHPHWQSTGAPQKNVAVPTADGVAKPNDWKPASRRPAALVGIGLVVTILFAFVHGVEYLQGQLLSETSIRILQDFTVDQPTVTVNPGAEIAWVNEYGDVVILQSETLCGSDGECMEIPSLPYTTVRYTVPVDAAQGSYIYSSTGGEGEPKITGEIIVSGDPVTPVERPEDFGFGDDFFENFPLPEDEPSTENTGDPLQEDDANEPVNEVVPPPTTTENDGAEPTAENEEDTLPPRPTPVSNLPTNNTENEEPLPTLNEEEPGGEFFPATEDDVSPPPFTGELPRNPYTVGSNLSPTPLPVGGPTPTELHGGAPLPPIRQHKPIRQPETGMGTWIGITLAVMGGAILLRRSRTTMLITEPRR